MEGAERTPDVIHRQVGTEVVVVRPGSQSAFALAAPAAAVWKAAEAGVLRSELARHTGLSDDVVTTALDALGDAGLISRPASSSLTRRTVLAGGAVAGAALVASIVLPTAAAAASSPFTSPGGGGAPGSSGSTGSGGSASGGDPTSFGTTSSGGATSGTGTAAATGSSSDPGQLAVTGSPVAQELLLGAGLVAAGAGAVAISRTHSRAGEVVGPTEPAVADSQS